MSVCVCGVRVRVSVSVRVRGRQGFPLKGTSLLDGHDVCVWACLCLCLFVCLIAACLFVCPCLLLGLSVFVCLLVCVCACVSVSVCVCVSVCGGVFACLRVGVFGPTNLRHTPIQGNPFSTPSWVFFDGTPRLYFKGEPRRTKTTRFIRPLYNNTPHHEIRWR